MKRPAFFIFVLNLTFICIGQQYRTSEIKAKADSILKIHITDSVFLNYTFYNTNSCYSYENKRGRLIWENLDKYKTTKGRLKEVEISWSLIIPNSYCPEYDTIKGRTSLEFDSLLNPKTKPNVDFIPDFYLNRESCNLISKDKALSDAKRLYLKTGIGSPQASLKYNVKTKVFIWEIRHVLSIKNNNHKFEMVELNASSGELIEHYFLEEATNY